MGGPRASFIIDGFDWYLLAGDNTARPAIRRRLVELPPTARALVFVEVESAEDRQLLPSQATTDVCWLHPTHAVPPGQALIDAIVVAELPAGAFHAWVACESGVAKTLRAALLAKGADKSVLKASGYWRRDAEAVHDVHE